MKFQIILPRFPHWQCLDDLADSVVTTLQHNGHTAYRAVATVDGIPVYLGTHVWGVPKHGIVYNTEPPELWPNYDLRQARAIWNCLPPFNLFPDKAALFLPGPIPVTVEPVEKDINVLFYGSLTPRRNEILERLSRLNPVIKFGVYGAERNALIARSRIVLDIKQREGDPDDITRMHLLDSMGACMLSENEPNALYRLRPNDILDQCRYLLQHPERQIRYRQRQFGYPDITAALALAERFRCPS